MKMPEMQMRTTQAIVDVAMGLAERWIKEDAERRQKGLPPSDYEPAAADLSSYLHTAIKEYARSFALQYAESVREACARECDRVRAVSAVSYETGAACAAAIRMKEE